MNIKDQKPYTWGTRLENKTQNDPTVQHIADLIAERDALRDSLASVMSRIVKTELANADLRMLVDDLRTEALAWHSKADTKANRVTITLSLDALRSLWAAARPCNPYANPED